MTRCALQPRLRSALGQPGALAWPLGAPHLLLVEAQGPGCMGHWVGLLPHPPHLRLQSLREMLQTVGQPTNLAHCQALTLFYLALHLFLVLLVLVVPILFLLTICHVCSTQLSAQRCSLEYLQQLLLRQALGTSLMLCMHPIVGIGDCSLFWRSLLAALLAVQIAPDTAALQEVSGR